MTSEFLIIVLIALFIFLVVMLVLNYFLDKWQNKVEESNYLTKEEYDKRKQQMSVEHEKKARK